MKLILLTFALVLFALAALYPEPAPWRMRSIAAGLAFWVASQYPF
jgi:hypothetical protein